MWTQEELDYLVENYPTMLNADIARHLGRSKASVVNKASKLGLKKDRDLVLANGFLWKSWTEEEESYLIENYRDTFNTDLAFKLGKSVGAVEQKAIRLKLTKGEDFLKRHIEGFKLKNNHPGGLKKGHKIGHRFTSDNQTKEMLEKATKTRNKLRKRERIRILYGLPRLTKWKSV